MTILDTISAFARDWRRQRRLSRTERKIGDLPFEIRKDIGWPDRFTAEIGHHPARDLRGR
jgi:hypothetical protein